MTTDNASSRLRFWFAEWISISSSKRNRRLRVLAWIGHSNGRSLLLSQALTVSHCRQRLDATLLGQKSANAFPNIGVALAVFRGFQHLPQNAHQFLFDTPVLFLERFEFFLCGDLCLAHAAQQHFDQFVTTLRTDLAGLWPAVRKAGLIGLFFGSIGLFRAMAFPALSLPLTLQVCMIDVL